jgi:HptB-dependent secretion and biofilm anti anti-sigma factor
MTTVFPGNATMPVTLDLQAGHCTLIITGKFTFEVHREFRQYSEQALEHPECRQLDMDLSGVEYLDSSALGMLLLVKEKAAALGKRVRLKGASGTTLQILQAVKFQEMFEFA